MVDTVYIEEAVLAHARTQSILRRYARAEHIVIERYGEVFNRHNQNFRLQKSNPALILARKDHKRVHAAPAQYETGGGAHYYFSHMLNCVYDCRYCFLQGMLRSANYVLFVNYEDFVDDLFSLAVEHQHHPKPTWFFSGYDCDSLAYEPITGFADFFLGACESLPNAVLEFRTKSTQIRSLLKTPARHNVVVAFSLSPEPVANHLEFGAPSARKRLEALQRLQQHGWRLGLRLDPVIWYDNYRSDYKSHINQIFKVLDSSKVDNITIGGFRLPKGFYKTMRKLHPEHWLMHAGLQERQDLVTYGQQIEQKMLGDIETMCFDHIERDRVFTYYNDDQA